MNLLILINGKADKLIDNNHLKADVLDIVKIDEKQLSSPKYIIRLINSKNYDKVYFGCILNELQRFQVFMKTWSLLSKTKQCVICDEKGNQNELKLFKYFCVELPSLLLELIASVFVVSYYYIKIPFLKWQLTKIR
jgi:hypothetical protein